MRGSSGQGTQSALKNGIILGAAFSVTVFMLAGLTVLFAQAMNNFAEGDLISAAKINENFQMAAPEGAIMAFYLSACPSGWVAADGNNSTPDLRGLFIRGLNDFGTGTRSDGNQDPDGAARAYTDVAPQGDQNQNHGHSVTNNVAVSGTAGPFHNLGCGCSGDRVYIATPGISNSGGNESRPKNHALIYCMRKDT